MPSWVTDDAKWEKAKGKVIDRKDKTEEEFSDQDWGLVTTIYKNMGGKIKKKQTEEKQGTATNPTGFQRLWSVETKTSNGIKVTLVGFWQDIGAYYRGADGNYWYTTPQGRWTNRGDNISGMRGKTLDGKALNTLPTLDEGNIEMKDMVEVMGYKLKASDKKLIDKFVKGDADGDSKNLSIENDMLTGPMRGTGQPLATRDKRGFITPHEAHGNISQTWINYVRKAAKKEGALREAEAPISDTMVDYMVQEIRVGREPESVITEADRWMSKMPKNCDLCSADLSKEEYWVDGATIQGPWGNMCPKCHKKFGRGLGTGRGQKYNSKTGKKMEG